MQCRPNCGACCIAPSITEPFHGMPKGKKAGEPCVHLQPDKRCAIFTDPARPQACAAFMPEPVVCGENSTQAMVLLNVLETATIQY